MCWGGFTLGLHFVWLLQLLFAKSYATSLQAISIFIFIFLYTAIIGGIYFTLISFIFKLKSIFLKLLFFFLNTLFLFQFISNYSLYFLGRKEGYPFLNPIIPLARYRWFKVLYGLFCFNFNINRHDYLKQLEDLKKIKTFYLKPCTQDFKKNYTPTEVGQDIYKKLVHLNLGKYSNDYKYLLVLAPETTYPFALNEHEEQIKLWDCAMTENTIFLLGSQRRTARSLYQSVFCVRSCRINDFYDKNHCMILTEKVPKLLRPFLWSKSLFLQNALEFKKGKNENKCFKICNDLIIFPKICSDFFYTTNLLNKNIQHNTYNKEQLIFIFVNDSWFMKFFKKIMKNFYYLIMVKYQKNIICITHDKIYKIM
ncbi:hypothetical protein GF322_00820 [Candidatus Dependentiae bacterium]|nr:hypothetical protein [Candidatus Dependentiae bacterium]